MISEADFIIYNTAKKRIRVSGNAETDAQTIVCLEKEVRYFRNEIEQLKGISNKSEEKNQGVMFLCDRRACDKCFNECQHTSEIKHAENFQLSIGGKFFVEKNAQKKTKADLRQQEEDAKGGSGECVCCKEWWKSNDDGLFPYLDAAQDSSFNNSKQENECLHMRIAELEIAAIVASKIKSIIDNDKQQYSDMARLQPDNTVRVIAQNKWKALDDLQKEIEQLEI